MTMFTCSEEQLRVSGKKGLVKTSKSRRRSTTSSLHLARSNALVTS